MPDLDTSRLVHEIHAVGRQVVAIDGKVNAVGQQVHSVGVAQAETRGELTQLRDEFRAFVRRAHLTANVQRAETRIGTLQDEVEHTFGHHKVVRRTAVGILQAFDVGLVTEEVVSAVSQELMVATPRYWLAPALVALAAWSADDPGLCDRAITEAFRRSPERTSLLFSLVLRRQGRQAGAVRWLRHYLGVQDPTSLGREFAVILESISQGAFGAAGVQLVEETLASWRQVLVQDDDARAAQVRRWRAEVDTHAQPSAGEQFPRLAAVCPQWALLDAGLGRAGAHRSLAARYGPMLTEESTPSDRIEDAVDDILDRLVSEYDADELPLRRELALHRATVAHDGDLDAARRAVDADAASFEDRLDYLTIQTTSALNPAAIGVSRPTQRLAVAACHAWFADAHAGYTRDYRAALPSEVEATFSARHGLGATVFDLPTWTGSFTTPLPELERSLTTHWERHTEPFVARLGYDRRRAAVLPAAVAVLVLIVLIGASPGLALVAAALVGGIWGFVIQGRYTRALALQDRMRQVLHQAERDSVTQLRGAAAELTDWTTRFRAEDAQEPATRELIASLGTAGHAVTPFEQRTVDVREVHR